MIKVISFLPTLLYTVELPFHDIQCTYASKIGIEIYSCETQGSTRVKTLYKRFVLSREIFK